MRTWRSRVLVWLTTALVVTATLQGVKLPSALAAGGPTHQAVFAVGRTEYTVDDKTTAMDAVPFVENDRTYVPVRFLATALGADVAWDEATQEVRLTKGSLQVVLRVGSAELRVGQKVIVMDVVPLKKNDRVYLPGRWVAEALGYFVSWDAAGQAIVIRPQQAARLAVIAPRTGDLSASYGREMTQGTELAVAAYADEFKRNGIALEMAVFDEGQGAGNAGNPADDMLRDSAVFGMVGPLTSGSALAIGAKLQGALVMVSPTSTDEAVTDTGWKHFNRIPPGETTASTALVRAAIRLGAKTAYVIQDSSPFGKMMADNFSTAAGQLGLIVNPKPVTLSGTPEQATEVAELVKANPDMVYIAAYYNTGVQAVKVLRGSGYRGILLGGDGVDFQEFPALAGEAANGVYYLSAAPTAEYMAGVEAGKKLLARHVELFGKDLPGPTTFLTYDAACVVLQATLDLLKQHPGQMPSRADVVAAVRATKGFPGLVSTITFGQKGENLGAQSWLLQYREGRYPGTYVDKVPTLQQ